MDRAGVDRWISGYRTAWMSDGPADIAALFTEEATYSPHPFTSDVWRGREQIVKHWIECGDSKLRWQFEHEIVAVDGDTAVVEGRTSYEATATDPATVYGNLWIIRFDSEARAREFSEWWVEQPRESGTDD